MRGNEQMNPEDRRVLRTRRLLKQALIDRAEDKTFEEITIRDITDHADIGYATFFRHYDGKEDLMLEIFTSIIEELSDIHVPDGQTRQLVIPAGSVDLSVDRFVDLRLFSEVEPVPIAELRHWFGPSGDTSTD